MTQINVGADKWTEILNGQSDDVLHFTQTDAGINISYQRFKASRSPESYSVCLTVELWEQLWNAYDEGKFKARVKRKRKRKKKSVSAPATSKPGSSPKIALPSLESLSASDVD